MNLRFESMLLGLLAKRSLFGALSRVDAELEEKDRAKGCPYGCGGRLHRAYYRRKPRGELTDVPEEWMLRRGLCCGWCRRRVLPPSCLFLGRRVFWFCVVLLVIAARQNRAEGATMRKLTALLGVSAKTVRRWGEWFRVELPVSSWWSRLRGSVGAAVSDDRLPAALLEVFAESCATMEQAVVRCLAFMAAGPGVRLTTLIEG